MLRYVGLCMITTFDKKEWEVSPLHLLAHIPQPPEKLYFEGALPAPELTLLAVVGSRRYSSYGKQVVNDLIEGLRSYPIGIVSGLARGIDGLAHEAALSAGLYTLAVPGSGLDRSVMYPRCHRGLADRIVTSGGGLLSELSPSTKAARWTFPQRNRLMAGVSTATLLIEATERSGTLITARMAVDYNRELLVVPGSIYSENSLGVHQFLKLGATPVTTSDDIITTLNLTRQSSPEKPDLSSFSQEAQITLTALKTPTDLDTLSQQTSLPPSILTVTLMQLEIEGYVRQENGYYHRRV